MTDLLRPGFPLRLNSELYRKKEEEEEEYLLKWGEHNNQVVNIFHQLCQVRYPSQALECFEQSLLILGGVADRRHSRH